MVAASLFYDRLQKAGATSPDTSVPIESLWKSLDSKLSTAKQLKPSVDRALWTLASTGVIVHHRSGKSNTFFLSDDAKQIVDRLFERGAKLSRVSVFIYMHMLESRNEEPADVTQLWSPKILLKTLSKNFKSMPWARRQMFAELLVNLQRFGVIEVVGSNVYMTDRARESGLDKTMTDISMKETLLNLGVPDANDEVENEAGIESEAESVDEDYVYTLAPPDDESTMEDLSAADAAAELEALRREAAMPLQEVLAMYGVVE